MIVATKILKPMKAHIIPKFNIFVATIMYYLVRVKRWSSADLKESVMKLIPGKPALHANKIVHDSSDEDIETNESPHNTKVAPPFRIKDIGRGSSIRPPVRLADSTSCSMPLPPVVSCSIPRLQVTACMRYCPQV
jgi:hypothetical protein